jgi:hypothetical protein
MAELFFGTVPYFLSSSEEKASMFCSFGRNVIKTHQRLELMAELFFGTVPYFLSLSQGKARVFCSFGRNVIKTHQLL